MVASSDNLNNQKITGIIRIKRITVQTKEADTHSGELILLPGDHLGVKVGTNLTGVKFSQTVEH
jgi:hypothetical protein